MLIQVEIIKDEKLWRRFQKVFANLEIKLCGRPTQVLFLINFDDGTCDHRVFSDERISYHTEITNFDDKKFEDEVLGWCMMFFCEITYQKIMYSLFDNQKLSYIKILYYLLIII